MDAQLVSPVSASQGTEMMRSLAIWRPSERLSVLCLGAHSEDIEIGIGGTERGRRS